MTEKMPRYDRKTQRNDRKTRRFIQKIPKIFTKKSQDLTESPQDFFRNNKLKKFKNLKNKPRFRVNIDYYLKKIKKTKEKKSWYV